MQALDDTDSWATADAEAPGAAVGSRWTPPPAGAPRSASSRRALLAVAVTPWVVVALLLLRPSASAEVEPVGPVVASPSEPVPEGAATWHTDEAPPATTREAVVAVGAGRDDRLAAVALLVVHATLGGPSTLALPGLGAGDPAAYVDHAVVERIVHPQADAAVVVVVATVLHAVDGQWAEARRVRVAVPLAFAGPSPVPAGEPWILGEWTAAVADLVPVPRDDLPHEDVAAAAERAGYVDVEVVSVAATDVWPLVADLRARAPGETVADEHHVWLEPDGDGLRLAGWRPPGASPTTAPTPTATPDTTTRPSTTATTTETAP